MTRKQLRILAISITALCFLGFIAWKVFLAIIGSAFGTECEPHRSWTIEEYTITEQRCIGWAGPAWFPLQLYRDNKEISAVNARSQRCIVTFELENGESLFFDTCKQKQLRDVTPSRFFEDCLCEKIDFSEGLVVTDSLRQFSVHVPDTSWRPVKRVENETSMILMAHQTDDGVSGVSVSLSHFDPPWSQELEDSTFLSGFEVIERGTSDSLKWHLVYEGLEAPPVLYAYYVNREDSLLLSTTFQTTDVLEPKVRFCELERVLETIKLH